MDKFNFVRARYYEVEYNLITSIIKNGQFVSNKTPLTLHSVMFYKSTNCYYVFWASRSNKYIHVKKTNLISAKEI